MELLEIEKELSGPNKEEAMQKYDAILLSCEERLSMALNKGVSVADFPKCEKLKEAIIVARKLLRLQIRDNN